MTEQKQAYRELKKRKHVSDSKTLRRKTTCGWMYLDFNYSDDFTINRVIIRLGKSGSCRMSYCEAIGELISLLFQGNYSPEIIIERLKGIRCGNEYIIEKDSPENNYSCSDCIAKALEEMLDILQEMKENKEKKNDKKN